MNKEALINIINNIRTYGWDEYSAFFNDDISLFLNIVNRNGLMELIDPLDSSFEDYENEILMILLEENPQETTKLISTEVINDVEISDGKYFLVLRDITDLANLFRNCGRDICSYDIANHILGEDDWEPYYDTVYSLYDDIIDNLNKENSEKLKRLVSEGIVGKTVEVETSLLEDFCEERDSCNGNEIEITSDMIESIFNDEKTIEFIIKDYLREIYFDLINIHSNAYNSAYYSEMYDAVWDELSRYFIGREIGKSRPNRYDETKVTRYSVIEIRDIGEDFFKFLSELRNSRWREDRLSYLGGYLEMLKSGVFEELDFRIPDYPDYGRVQTNINQYFNDYL